jgi:DNA polymerase-3 subunit gamma/tau
VATLDRPSSFAAPALAPSPFAGSTPFPVEASQSPAFAADRNLTEGALAVAPQLSLAAPSLEAVRHAIGSALVDGGHVSAATLLGSAQWILDGTSLRIEVPGMGKKMLALTVNAAAEKIIRQELQRLGAPARFMVVPGDGIASTASTTAAPIAGSIQEAALANPLVQQAREIFKAEVRSVIDLRQK